MTDYYFIPLLVFFVGISLYLIVFKAIKQKSASENFKSKKRSFIKNTAIVIAAIIGICVFGYLAHLKSCDIRSLKEYNEWRNVKKISTLYKKEKEIAKNVLIYPAQYNQPSKYWKRFFTKLNANQLDVLFYTLKIWYLEHDLKRLDLRDSYPIFSKSESGGHRVTIIFKQRGNLPGIELIYTKSLSDQETLISNIQILNSTEFSFDINKDGRINTKDVIAIKDTKPYLNNEYIPENFGYRKFRSWTIEDKDRLLDVVNSKCIEHYSSWEELISDRYVKCNSISRGRIGWEYWGLPGSQSTHSTKFTACFILGVLIPGSLIFLFIKSTKGKKYFKKSLSFKITVWALFLYFCFTYFIFVPFTNKAVKAIYSDDLVTLKKYWTFINPEITSDVVIVFWPSFSRRSDSSSILLTINDVVKNPLKVAISSGSGKVVKFLVEDKGLQLPELPLYLASKSGSLATVKYLVEILGIEVTDESIKAAGDKGFIDVAQYLISQYPKDMQEIDLATLAMSGDLGLFKTVLDSGNNELMDICIALKEAIRTYNNDIAKHIINSYPEIFNFDFDKKSKQLVMFRGIFSRAVIYDNLEILSILIKHQPLVIEHYP